MIKYVYSIDYPLGKKEEYLGWVKSVAAALQSPDEVKRVASFDNYYAQSPHRVVEFEFEDTMGAAKYFERAEIRQVLDNLLAKGTNVHMQVFILRGDYTKK